jgi:hypothetical protein
MNEIQRVSTNFSYFSGEFSSSITRFGGLTFNNLNTLLSVSSLVSRTHFPSYFDASRMAVLSIRICPDLVTRRYRLKRREANRSIAHWALESSPLWDESSTSSTDTVVFGVHTGIRHKKGAAQIPSPKVRTNLFDCGDIGGIAREDPASDRNAFPCYGQGYHHLGRPGAFFAVTEFPQSGVGLLAILSLWAS